MTQRQAVQQVSVLAPLRQVGVQQGDEPLVVVPLQQVRQLVDKDVLEALYRLFRQFSVEADGPGVGVAAAPAGLHALDEEPLHPHPQDRLPLLDQPGGDLPDLLAVPGGNDPLPLLLARSGPDPQHQGAGIEHHSRGGVLLDHLEQITRAPEGVTLAVEKLARCLPRLLPQLALLLLDPGELGDREDAQGVQVHARRRGDPDLAIRRIDAEMDVLDVLEDDLHRQVAQHDVAQPDVVQV